MRVTLHDLMSTVSIVFSDKLTGLKALDRQRLQFGMIEWMFGEIDKPDEWEIARIANEWKILVHESSESSLGEYAALINTGDELNPGIPHGITRKNIKQIDVFIPNVGGILGLRQAFDAISHEIAHMMVSILVDLGKLPARSRRRLQDKTNPPGSEGNTEVVEVHDRVNEIKQGTRSSKKFRVSGHNVNGLDLGDYELVGIDITDLINTATP